MKYRFVKDILVYILIPILAFNINIFANIWHTFRGVIFISILYTIYTKIKEERINTTGIFIFIIFISYFIYNGSQDGRVIYFYNTCILLIGALVIPSLKIFNKDIGIIIIKDILRALNRNSLMIIKILKKKSIANEIKKTSAMIETGLISVSLIRVLNILTYECNSNSYLNFISRVIGLGFLGGIVYKVIKLVSESKKLKILTNKPGQNLNDNNKGKVINFNNFR